MGKHTTYSFLDLAGAISHPSVGPYVFTGEGVGEVNLNMTTDRSVHDVAADGVVMVSKIAGNNGTVNIICQQTSNLHKWLLKYYNAVIADDTSLWAAGAMVLRNVSDGTSHMVTGLSFTKKADKSYQSQGQRVTWAFMAADISEMPV